MAKKDLLVLVPTKGRVDNVRRLYDHLTSNKIPHIFCMDDDDPTVREVRKFTAGVWVDTPKRLGPWLNLASAKYADEYDTIGFIGDDVVPRTANWWEPIIESHGKNSMVYTNDGHQGEGLPAAIFMDTGLIKKLGYMVYPQFTHLYIDNHWKVLGEGLGTLKYLPDVYLEHMHPYAGKADMDATYEAANSSQMYSKDLVTFNYYVNHVLPHDLRRAQ